MTHIIDGKKIANDICTELKSVVQELNKGGETITLAVVLVGENPASKIYVANKKKTCNGIGIISQEYNLPQTTTENELLKLIDDLNTSNEVDGILVQLPLPAHINEKNVIERIHPEKDVDSFCEVNVGKLVTKNYRFLPCTPAGIIEILKHENIEISGKHCVILGRSNIVGKPLALLMLNNDATVTICHSKTKNLHDICKQADILIAAIGQPRFVKSDMIKPGAIVIDVGINRDASGKICGDVDFENVKDVASYITPVPGGVGPMTVAMLMKNVIAAKSNPFWYKVKINT